MRVFQVSTTNTHLNAIEVSLPVIEYNLLHQERLSSSVMSIKGLPKRLFHDCYQGQAILYLKVTLLLLYSFLIYT